ncbi:glycosyltransferase [Naasia lichenicola]|uniref:Glycosyltransferase n=1 Tax=Naasia lichenicola TaxID=2565933 RepID=A0A4S4FKX7_9MICO|nr:glycosyltransferase [Naasia lichenicola]THG30818.1 glycosyltransferase [Naasia lichenicola]
MPLPPHVDLTVVVTTHGEGRLLRPTLRSVESGIAMLDGESVELLLVRDNADALTIRETDSWAARTTPTYSTRILDVAFGESGASRNAGATAATGEYVAFVDGDDLVSARYLVGALHALRSSTVPLVMHPEYVVSFGARTLLWRTESTRTHDISYRDLIRHNIWPSSAVTRRDLFLAHPYRSLPPEAGYGPEDWIWNIDTSAAGIAHDVVDDSVFFYRVRARGGVNNRHAISVLPHFDLDALRRQLPLTGHAGDTPSSRGFRHALVGLYHVTRPIARRLTGWLSSDIRSVIYRTARWTARAITGRGATETIGEIPPRVLSALHAASELDPSISWAAYRFQTTPVWHARDDGYAEIIEAALERLPSQGGAIVAVPWVGIGGADLVSLNYARALQASERFSGKTSFLGTFLEERTRLDLIPDDIPYVHLHKRWLAFPPHVRRRLIAQIIILARPELLVSVNSFHVTESLQDHAAQITDGTRVFATLFAFDRIGDGFPVNPITDDSQRDYLDHIDGLITDNTMTAALIEEILALPRDHILVHRQPAAGERPASTGWAASDDTAFTAAHPFRLLWPHRLDEEKRPDALIAIAQELTRRKLPAVVEIWGQRVLTGEGDGLMKNLARAGVLYRGPYSGGLSGIDLSGYHTLLLTSKSEGLPLVLVQALQMGLPVLASNVGGVPDIIIDGETGLLTAGPDDAVGYADAVERLMADIDLRRSLISGGERFARERHSWQAFLGTVEGSLFG